MDFKKEALEYHSRDRKGKVEVTPTKPCATQRDLSMAYTPGVAEPCRYIHENPEDAYTYTAKGNLVAVVSNGTAVLGLGNIGPLAGFCKGNGPIQAVGIGQRQVRQTVGDSPGYKVRDRSRRAQQREMGMNVKVSEARA